MNYRDEIFGRFHEIIATGLDGFLEAKQSGANKVETIDWEFEWAKNNLELGHRRILFRIVDGRVDEMVPLPIIQLMLLDGRHCSRWQIESDLKHGQTLEIISLILMYL